MSEVRRKERLDLRMAFAVSVIVWFLPTCGRWAIGTIDGRELLYEIVVTVSLNLLALMLIQLVFRVAREKGWSLARSIVFASVSTVPAMTLGFVLDWALVERDPTSAWPGVTRGDTLGSVLISGFAEAVGICIFLSAVVFLPMLARAHEERIQELELVQRDAELLRIKAHLEPHFILNSLNAVAGLIDEEPAQARELLASLGELFRQASTFRSTHRVADEIEWLRRYVTIHELRYSDRMHVSWDVEESSLNVECPALLLQPLVENAIRHGVLRGGGHLAVRVRKKGNVLEFSVEDDGPGLGRLRPEGQGLLIVKRRLAVEGLAQSSFDLLREGDVTAARIRIPVSAGGNNG